MAVVPRQAVRRSARGTDISASTAFPGAWSRRRARMFTGIVEDLGEIEEVGQLGDFARITVRSAVASQDTRPGDSICVNGVCLTVTGLLGGPPPASSNPDAPPPPARPG